MNMVLRKGKIVLRRLFLGLVLGITLVSCKQNPIFFSISQEVEPRDPRINGMPTAIVQVGATLYVASRFSETIHQYGNGRWSSIPRQPGGKILELAAAGNHLYALAGDPGSQGLRKLNMNNGGTWETVETGNADVQSIYGAGDYVFAGIMTDTGKSSDGTSVNGFEIWYTREDTAILRRLKERTAFLTGAVHDGTTYYLAVGTNEIDITSEPGGGIYTFNGTGVTMSPAAGSEKLNMVGIIMVKDIVVGITRGGGIVYGKDGNFEVSSHSITFTGALGLWEKEGRHLLLLGIQGGSSSTVHGYREVKLRPDGTLDSGALGLQIPGEDPEHSSVTNNNKYNSTIRRHPVMGFLQAPDTVLFAATVKNGLWSYRERDGEDVWNAED
jgi:hypothetical protein